MSLTYVAQDFWTMLSDEMTGVREALDDTDSANPLSYTPPSEHLPNDSSNDATVTRAAQLCLADRASMSTMSDAALS